MVAEKQISVASLKTEKGLAELNELLADRSYVARTPCATAEDIAYFSAISCTFDKQQFPHLARWVSHIAGLKAAFQEGYQWPSKSSATATPANGKDAKAKAAAADPKAKAAKASKPAKPAKPPPGVEAAPAEEDTGNYTFLPVDKDPNFPAFEVKMMHYWRDINAYEEGLKQSQGKPAWGFYDGPPFATGLPHYGHILAGTIKDVVVRHAHQRGYHIERRFGWDCHGVPIEGVVNKKLGITSNSDVKKMGIDKYNEECRANVFMFISEWQRIVERFGRWVDFKNDYKTLDLGFMESVWWVFKSIYDKGLVYRAFKVIAYSTPLATPLSNFEVAQNYKDVSDPSIIVKLKRRDNENGWLLIWTTTPWTLPSNQAVCVHPELVYVTVKNKETGEEWTCGKDRFEWICSSAKKDPKDFDVLQETVGADLVGIRYFPIFDYFKGKLDEEQCWRVVSDGYVTNSAGTCIVHQAPAHGEDDMRVCIKHGIVSKDGKGMIDVVDESGTYRADIPDFQGVNVKEADKGLKEKLKKQGVLVFNEMFVHSYPHCWRSDTPLIYKAIPAWFIKVEHLRQDFLRNNDLTYWVPPFVREKRFHNWLAEARDWCVSRNRYWGCPIPLWVSDDFEEVVCVGSVAELEQYAGRKIDDIHMHLIDDITIPSKMGKGRLKRVSEVFDCWFESGSMPYAQQHYPFENKEKFESIYPADFIAEGIDQTRGWFYSLHVISTILFDKPAFKNLIVNGIVLASDGKKMSKRLKNYPDPVEMTDKYGADAVRMYMVSSPVVRADNIAFKEDGVRDVVKDVFLPWYNAYNFFVQETTRYERERGQKFAPDPEMIKKSSNYMDKWINAAQHNFIQFVRDELMPCYRLYTPMGAFINLLEDLTNWYVRLNRDRMRGNAGLDEALTSLCTLFDVLMNVTVLMSAVTPFITELIYQNLSRAFPDGHPMKQKSVHYVMAPEPDAAAMDPAILTGVKRMQNVVELGRLCREQKKVGSKLPLKSLTLYSQDDSLIKDIETLKSYVMEELNVMEVRFSKDTDKICLGAVLNFKVVGKKLGKDMKAAQEAVKTLSQEALEAFEKEGKITLLGHELSSEDVTLVRKLQGIDDPNLHFNGDGQTYVVLDFTPDEDLIQMGNAREIVNRVQTLRKEAGLKVDSLVDMWAEAGKAKNDAKVAEVLSNKAEYINKLLRKPLFSAKLRQGHEALVVEKQEEVAGGKFTIYITQRCAYFNMEELKKLAGGDVEAVKQQAAAMSCGDLAKLCKAGESLKCDVKGKTYALEHKKHFSLGPADASWLSK